MRSDLWLKEHFQAEFFSPTDNDFTHLVEQYLKTKIAAKIVTVAGTNGKGQTCFELAVLLKQEGQSFCLWSSPHISSVSERFRNQNGNIDDDELLAIFKLVFSGLEHNKVSYYEFLFLCFLEFARRRTPDVLILEVGLGGRLDAVNEIDADVAVITSVARDHQEFLGSSLRGILLEKIAIARPGKVLISALETQYLQKSAASYCEANSIEHFDLYQRKLIDSEADFNTSNKSLAQVIMAQILNKKMGELGICNQSSPQGLKKIRMGDHELELKGTHNVDGMRKLVQFLYRELYNEDKDSGYDELVVSFSRRDEKDIETMIKVLKSYPCLFKKITIAVGDFHKAVDEEVIHRIARKFEINFTHNWQEYIEGVQGPKKFFVTGSNYFIGEILNTIAVSN